MTTSVYWLGQSHVEYRWYLLATYDTDQRIMQHWIEYKTQSDTISSTMLVSRHWKQIECDKHLPRPLKYWLPAKYDEGRQNVLQVSFNLWAHHNIINDILTSRQHALQSFSCSSTLSFNFVASSSLLSTVWLIIPGSAQSVWTQWSTRKATKLDVTGMSYDVWQCKTPADPTKNLFRLLKV